MRVSTLLLLIPVCTPGGLAGQGQVPDRDEQISLALSAAPAHIRDGAGLLTLGAAGYSVARPSANGFWCLMERWDRSTVVPICYDRVGAASTLRVVRYLEERRSVGVADSVLFGEIEAGYGNGTFIAPKGYGVAYMLSPFGPAPPHVMYYAPYARNEEFHGASGKGRAVLPFIYEEGTPRAYIVQLVDPAAWARLDGREAGRP